MTKWGTSWKRLRRWSQTRSSRDAGGTDRCTVGRDARVVWRGSCATRSIATTLEDSESKRTPGCSEALGRDSKRMTYNHHGDQIEEISEHEQRDFSIDDWGRLSDGPTKESVSRSEARFRYDYDVTVATGSRKLSKRAAALTRRSRCPSVEQRLAHSITMSEP